MASEHSIKRVLRRVDPLTSIEWSKVLAAALDYAGAYPKAGAEACVKIALRKLDQHHEIRTRQKHRSICRAA